MKTFRLLLASESGATLVEYALIISLIAIIVIGVAQTFGIALNGMYQKIASTLKGA